MLKVDVEYDELEHTKMYGAVHYGKIRIRASFRSAFEHMQPLLHKAVAGALMSPLPARTGSTYMLYVDGVKRKHVASRFGETPAPLTGRLANSVRVVYDGTELKVVELAPYAKYLEGEMAARVGGSRFRPHLRRLCSPYDETFRDVLQEKMHYALHGE